MNGFTRSTRGALAIAIAALVSLIATIGTAQAADQVRVDPKAPCFRWPAVDYDGDGVYDRIDYCPNTPKGCSVDERGCPHDADGDGVCDELDRCANTPKGERVNAEGCSPSQQPGQATPPPAAPVTPPPPVVKPVTPPPATPPPSKVEQQLVSGGVVRLDNIYFETNSAKLLPESESTLNEAGVALGKYPELKVEIGGHTDTRGAAVANRRLSQSRAESVRRYLLDHYSLKAENLVAKGYGESQPLNKEATPEELQQNRRVELKVLNPGVLPSNVKIQN